MISDETRKKLSEAGRRGGKAKVPKGFAMNLELAKQAAYKGAEAANAKRKLKK